MKFAGIFSFAVGLSICVVTSAQTSGAKHKELPDCEGRKGNALQNCREVKKPKNPVDKFDAMHKATGVVKAVDPVYGSVMIEHGPVASLKWPAMTMSFVVRDKTLFNKLTKGAKVKVEFRKDNADYVVTAVK